MGKERFDIIFVLMNSWENYQVNGFRTREAIILKRLARSERVNRILVVDNTEPSLSLFFRISGYLEQVDDKVFLYRSIYLKMLHYLVFPKWGLRRWAISLENFFIKNLCEATEKIGLKTPVLWMTNALRTNLIGRLDERLVAFDAIDNWLEHPQFMRHRPMVERGYQEIIRKADVIFTVSRTMAEFFGKERDNVFHVPNAVDLSLFQNTANPVSPDLKDIPHPRIGYVGVLQERLDVALIDYLSVNCPDMNFVFVGPVLTPRYFEPLRNRKNIVFTGNRHSSLVPDYIRSFDVCMIPHKTDRFTASMDPLKLYEYLAAGKPVISAPLPSGADFENVISIARSREEFVDKLRSSVKSSDDEGAKTLRIEKAKQNSWDVRMEEFFRIMDSALGNRLRHLPKIFIIILTWNGKEDTVECIKSVQGMDYSNFEILIVDNGSTDDSVKILREAFPDIAVIRTGRNIGYTGGNNAGIKHAMEQGMDYAIILNNDTIVEKDFVSEWVAVAERDKTIGMSSPKIYYYDRPDVIWYAGATFYPLIGYGRHRGADRKDNGRYDRVEDTKRPCGCALMVSRKLCEDVGLLNEDYFCYYEEVDWSYRAREKGFRVVYIPSARVWHKVSASTGGVRTGKYLYYSTRNLLYCLRDHLPLRWKWFEKVREAAVISANICSLFTIGVHKREGIKNIWKGFLDYRRNIKGMKQEVV